eukprot:12304435-Alexandrium_andersonii.AAC.1
MTACCGKRLLSDSLALRTCDLATAHQPQLRTNSLFARRPSVLTPDAPTCTTAHPEDEATRP